MAVGPGRDLTHYEVLGVGPGASADELRRAYLALARRHHPDVAGGSAERMQALTAAWSVLGDPARRAAYDRSLGAPTPPGAEPFRPFDDSPAPDPLDQLDVPYRPAPTVNRSLPLVPVGLFAATVAVFCVGMVTGIAALLGFAVVLFVVASLGFFVLPLLALSRARDDEG